MAEKGREEKQNTEGTRRFWIQKLTSSQFNRYSTELTEALLSAAVEALRVADELVLSKDSDDIVMEDVPQVPHTSKQHLIIKLRGKPLNKDDNLPFKKKPSMRLIPGPDFGDESGYDYEALHERREHAKRTMPPPSSPAPPEASCKRRKNDKEIMPPPSPPAAMEIDYEASYKRRKHDKKTMPPPPPPAEGIDYKALYELCKHDKKVMPPPPPPAMGIAYEASCRRRKYEKKIILPPPPPAMGIAYEASYKRRKHDKKIILPPPPPPPPPPAKGIDYKTLYKLREQAKKMMPPPPPRPPTKGIVISGTGKTGTRLKKEKDSGYSRPKRVAFKGPVIGNVRRLNELRNRLFRKNYKFRGLEARINAVLKETLRENLEVGDETKRSFFEWLKRFDRLDYDWDFVNAIKAVAALYGIKLTQLLAELINLISESGNEGGMSKLRVLRATLRWIVEGQNSIVIHRVVAVLDSIEEVEGKIKEKGDEDDEKQKKDKGKGKAVMIEEEEPQSNEITDVLIEDVSDIPILGLLNLTLTMEHFWMQQRLPTSEESFRGTFFQLEEEVDTFLRKLYLIESEVTEMRELSAFYFQDEDGKSNKEKTECYTSIEELWDRIEDLEFK